MDRPLRTKNTHTVAIIGFGEAGKAFFSGWRNSANAAFKAYDIKTETPGKARDQMLAKYQDAGIEGCETAAEAISQADAIFSIVTADQALAAARKVAQKYPTHALYFDCNSCAPETKRQAAQIINKAGGRYIDVAVMAPVHPLLHRTPVFVSSPEVDDALEVLNDLDMSARRMGGAVGEASAIKLVRSVMIKGLEALTAECLLAGRNLGVEEPVLETLDETFPEFNWRERANRMLERSMVHGLRRAAEMSETAKMLESAGLPGRMARATAAWQQQIGELYLSGTHENYKTRTDEILRGLNLARNPEDI